MYGNYVIITPGVCYSTHNNVNQRYLNPGGKRHKITFFWNTFFWVTSVTKIDIQLKTFMFYNFHAFSGYFFLTQNVMQKFHCVNVLRTHINYWWQKSENLYFDTIGFTEVRGQNFLRFVVKICSFSKRIFGHGFEKISCDSSMTWCVWTSIGILR